MFEFPGKGPDSTNAALSTGLQTAKNFKKTTERKRNHSFYPTPNVKRERDNQPTPKQLNNERSKYRPNDLSVSVALHSHYISKQIRKSRASIIFVWNAHKQSKRRNRYSGTSKIRDTEYN
jgi:hypothetical protein